MYHRFVALCALLLAAAPAAAQVSFSAYIGVWPGNTMFNGFRVQEDFRALTEPPASAPSSASANAAPSATSSAARLRAAALAFTPSPARRRANLARFVEAVRAQDPQGAAALRRQFAEEDVVAAMARELAPYGLRVDNVADAYAVYWINAWQAAHGDVRETTRAQALAVRALVARAMAGTPAVRAATDAQRQEFAEALLVQAALIGRAQQASKDDPAMSRRLAATVRQGAQAIGLDLDATTLTDEGFAPAR